MRKHGNPKQNVHGGPHSTDADYQSKRGNSGNLRELTKENPSSIDDRATSPSAWIYKGGKTLQDFCRPFIGGGTPAKVGNKSDASVASWRKMAAKTILSSENINSDDEFEKPNDGSRGGRLDDDHMQHSQFRLDSSKEDSAEVSSKSLPYVGNLTMIPDEPRIIAPNVSKLSPRSVVEIRLQSTNECVAILCSVDVLKMRSSFFYEVLNEQEDNRAYGSREQHDIWRHPLLIPETSPFEAAAFLESLHEGRSVFKGDWVYCWARLSVAWQIQDLVLEYASQIDLHFGNLFSIVKSKSWRTNPNIWVGARVAVFRKGATPMPTVVTGTIIDSGSAISYSKIRVQFDSSEPSRVPVVQKVVHCSSAISASMMSVGFFGLDTPLCSPIGNSYMSNNNGTNNAHQAVPFTPRIPNSPRSLHTPTSSSGMNARGAANGAGLGSIPGGSVIADVGEPFWVQLLHPRTHGVSTPIPTTTHRTHYDSALEGAPLTDACDIKRSDSKECNAFQGYGTWSDPDEQSMAEMKKYVTATDKRMFWEMTKAIIELPEITEFCSMSIKSSKDLAILLRKTEYKVLWTSEGADIIPKQTAADLVRAAYVSDADSRSSNV